MNKFMRLFSTVVASIAIIVAIVLGCISSYSNKSIVLADRINTRKKVIMLTFDDGPYTYEAKPQPGFPPTLWSYDPVKSTDLTIDDGILDILNDKGIQYYGRPISGTFFEIGSHIDKRETNPKFTKTMTRILNSGSWIGSHTYSHDSYSGRPEYGIQDIRKSYKSITKFYKEYFTELKQSKNYPESIIDVSPSKQTISNLNIVSTNSTYTVNVPLRLGYLQTYKGMNDIKDILHIDTLVYGWLGTDWAQTANAKAPDIEKYFHDNNLGDYSKMKSKYGDSGTQSTDAAKDFYTKEWNAKKNISIKKILAYEELHVTDGAILVCHTRTFAKYWLPQLIDYCYQNGYSFAGMNPFNKGSYYKNFGNLIN